MQTNTAANFQVGSFTSTLAGLFQTGVRSLSATGPRAARRSWLTSACAGATVGAVQQGEGEINRRPGGPDAVTLTADASNQPDRLYMLHLDTQGR
jgi:hypothetical protein